MGGIETGEGGPGEGNEKKDMRKRRNRILTGEQGERKIANRSNRK